MGSRIRDRLDTIPDHRHPAPILCVICRPHRVPLVRGGAVVEGASVGEVAGDGGCASAGAVTLIESLFFGSAAEGFWCSRPCKTG